MGANSDDRQGVIGKASDFQLVKKEKERKRGKEEGKRKKKKHRKTRLTLIGGTRKCAYITYVLQPRNIISLSSR